MPKVTNRRIDRARQLLTRLEKGPHFSSFGPDEFTTVEASDQYRNWARSWILSDLVDLIPELRQDKKEKEMEKEKESNGV